MDEGDEQNVARLAHEVNERRRQQRMDYGAVFHTEAGKRVLADLARFCGANRTSFCAEDAHRTAFFEGQRNVYLYIKTQLTEADDE